MDKFIAVKPVRFDRNYSVGEIIPSTVINPASVKRLIDLGKIQRVPEDDPLTGPDVEKALAFVEDALGIDHGEDIPEIGDRAEAIKARVAELAEQAARLEAEKPPEDDGEGDAPDAQKTPPEGAEVGVDTNTQPDPESANVGQPDAPVGDAGAAVNVQTVNLTKQPAPEGGQEADPEGATGDNCECVDKSGYPDATCPVCGRVMGSKGALTTHMKKEHPDYKA